MEDCKIVVKVTLKAALQFSVFTQIAEGGMDSQRVTNVYYTHNMLTDPRNTKSTSSTRGSRVWPKTPQTQTCLATNATLIEDSYNSTLILYVPRLFHAITIYYKL